MEHRKVNERTVADYQIVNYAVVECATKLNAVCLSNTQIVWLLDWEKLGTSCIEDAIGA